LKRERVFDLARQIRRRIDQEPTTNIVGDGDARLGLRSDPTFARGAAICARAIPLRQPAAGSATQDPNANR
jgi:hypothetical protein